MLITLESEKNWPKRRRQRLSTRSACHIQMGTTEKEVPILFFSYSCRCCCCMTNNFFSFPLPILNLELAAMWRLKMSNLYGAFGEIPAPTIAPWSVFSFIHTEQQLEVYFFFLFFTLQFSIYTTHVHTRWWDSSFTAMPEYCWFDDWGT